jgi:O-antigen/teichoic acid export membrane protein
VYYQRIIEWFKDDISRRLFVNAGWLLSAKSIAAVLGFVTAFLAANGLQPAGYGVLALVVAYVHTVNKLVSFQSWQAIIKFGNDALVKGEREKFQQLIKLGFVLDCNSAVVGTAIAIGVSSSMLALLSWDQALQPLIFIYSWLILFSIGGTPIGLLRLFNRFDLLSYNSVVTAIIRLAGVGWCWLTGQSLEMYVLAFLIAGIVEQLLLFAMAMNELHRHRLTKFLSVPLRGVRAHFPGILNYVWTTNLYASVKVVSRELDIVIVAGFAGTGSVGIYKLAKQFAKVLSSFSDPLYQSIFPELSRLWSVNRGNNFFTLMKRSTIIVGGGAIIAWIIFFVVGSWFIQLVVGPEYSNAHSIAVIYMLGTVIALITFSFTPALLAMGLPVKSFIANVLASCIYILSLIPLLILLDLAGAALAYVVYYLVWSAFMLYMLMPRFRTLKMVGQNV